MKIFIAALAGTALLLGAADAQEGRGHEGPKERAQQHGNSHDRSPEATPGTRRPGMGGPDRRGDIAVGHPDMGRDRKDGGPDRKNFRSHDFRNFHGNFDADRRFHAGPWHPPRGYQYRRWTYGERLPAHYYASGLWITRFSLYGLMAPLPDTVWVRSGPDALLVDRTSGEIIRVEYGVFY